MTCQRTPREISAIFVNCDMEKANWCLTKYRSQAHVCPGACSPGLNHNCNALRELNAHNSVLLWILCGFYHGLGEENIACCCYSYVASEKADQKWVLLEGHTQDLLGVFSTACGHVQIQQTRASEVSWWKWGVELGLEPELELGMKLGLLLELSILILPPFPRFSSDQWSLGAVQ